MPELPAHGCRIDAEPQDCVFDAGEHHLCLYAVEITRRHECPWWREEEASPAEPGGRKPRRRGATGPQA